MRYSNVQNLPEVLVRALAEERNKPNDNEISVTDLISPPLIHTLKKKHWDEIEIDISEKIWALLGISVHYYLEKHAPDEALAEEFLDVEFNGWRILGRKDLYYNKAICDYKVTSARSLQEERRDWIYQLNLYKWMLEQIGFEVEKLYIYVFIRDWTRKNEKQFPIPFSVIEIPILSKEEIETFLIKRLSLQKLCDENPFECSDEEKWFRKGVVILFDENGNEVRTFFSAEKMANLYLVGNQFLEIRSWHFIRCTNYCLVRNICPFAEKNKMKIVRVSAQTFNTKRDDILKTVEILLSPNDKERR